MAIVGNFVLVVIVVKTVIVGNFVEVVVFWLRKF